MKQQDETLLYLQSTDGVILLLIIILILMFCLFSPNICYWIHKDNIKSIQEKSK